MTGGFPLHNSLAATENLLGWQLFHMPLRWAGASVACAYNILLIASLVLSAIGASLFARGLGIRGEGAFLAGLIFAFVPFLLNHLLHLQTMAVCWAPFALFALDRFLDKGKGVDLVGVVRGQPMARLPGYTLEYNERSGRWSLENDG
ncbi:MAG TPA: hypothetical protein VFE97_26090 [Methylomirabilota bacterium]|nr:hypothetical protein [Methylomirabilota bacterium]